MHRSHGRGGGANMCALITCRMSSASNGASGASGTNEEVSGDGPLLFHLRSN